MKYFFIAGERSGDLHGSNLIKELKRLDFEAEISGYGGDMMASEGMGLIRHYKNYSFMGIWEVITHLSAIRKEIRNCKKAIAQAQPDVLVLVDFPGFNLRMAKYAKQLGIKTCYYISPKIWAWKKGRIKTIRQVVDKMLVILPFEVDFYRQMNFPVEYVGNPLMDATRTYDFQEIETSDQPTIAVLPGSRMQEVRSAVPVIKEMARLRPDYQFLVAGVSNLPKAAYQTLIEHSNVQMYYDRAYDLLKAANASVVTSGTATLEACLLSAPQVVVYKTSWLTYKIGRMVIKVPYLSLVNLIAEREVVRELIQEDFNAHTVLEEVEKIIHDSQYCSRILDDYMQVKEKMGFEPASKRAAKALNEWLETK